MPGGQYYAGTKITETKGEKWFCSNPDADLAMVLARPKEYPSGTKGLSLFLLPKILQNGSPNNYEIIRLKDKLGGKSFASGEIKLKISKLKHH